MAGVDSIQLGTRGLLGFHLGCHGGCVAMAAGWLANACRAGGGPPCRVLTQYDWGGGVVGVSLWLPWRRGGWLMPVVPGSIHAEYWLNAT